MASNNIKNPPPCVENSTIYEYKFDTEVGEWRGWVETLDSYKYDPKLSFSELIIPTKDSICYTYLLDILIRNNKHVLMTGSSMHRISKLSTTTAAEVPTGTRAHDTNVRGRRLGFLEIRYTNVFSQASPYN
jgi:hypothetical protein